MGSCDPPHVTHLSYRPEPCPASVLLSPPSMRWTPGGVSSDIEDRRGGGGGFGGFGRGPQIGCGGAIILLVLSLLTGRNFFALFDGSGGTAQGPGPNEPGQVAPPSSQTPEEQKAVQFVSFVLDDAQATW